MLDNNELFKSHSDLRNELAMVKADHEAALKAAQHMDDLLEQDGRTDDQVWEHIDWCRQQAEAVR